MYLIGRSRSVDLVDIDSSAIVHTFHTELMQPRSLKQISLTRPQQSGLASITLSYISAETGDLTIHTYLPETDTDTFPVSPIEPIPSGPHSPWSRTNETINYITNPGVWEALPSGNIVGVRKKQTTPPSSLSTSTSTSSLSTPHLAGLRRRTASPPFPDPHHHHSSGTTPNPETTQHWEAYTLNLRPDHTTTTTLSHSGSNSTSNPKPTFETRALDDAPSHGDHTQSNDSSSSSSSHLMVSEPGPIVRLGTTSVAVGLGDVVKVVSVGRSGSLGMGMDGLGTSMMGVGSRRKKVGGLAAAGRGVGVGGSRGGGV
jgi:hypothetical protein